MTTARTRRKFSQTEREELWQRWQRGESVSEIARALDRKAGTIHTLLASRGGFAPRKRKRNEQHLTAREREDISRGISQGKSGRRIAEELGRAPSTVTREIRRNGGRRAYRAVQADARAWRQSLRPKRCKLAQNARLRNLVARKLSEDWSPPQISGWLRAEVGAAGRDYVSHETIYKSLFVQARGVLKKELLTHLRSNRGMRHGRASTTKGQPRGQIKNAISIRERPAEVEDRAVPGHWEGDLLSGRGNTHVATLVERHSRFTILVKVPGKDTESVTRALAKQILKLPSELRRSVTWDRGMEMASHQRLAIATGVQVYFCDPQSPWQRGTNENTNRLLRQYFPKGERLDGYSQAQLNVVARRLNSRPRKTLNFKTPAETLDVALTG